MKGIYRWRYFVLGLILFSVSASIFAYARRKQAQIKREEREGAYQTTLKAYSEDLPSGKTRKEVEDYIHARGAHIVQMCCVDERSALADLVKIGKEDAPWFCSEQNIYVAFQFAAAEPHDVVEAHDTDNLRKITIFRWLEGCL
ncbi:MAG: hypothetical protein WCA19_05420 [Candidatus Acidiferrales bacterium]